ncbi:hypothetical protein [Actinoplanes solisilvae]|uniref:hypothetical protein n=1 Tax=Actinoplanes solisilvae TaxID=2486853 RepID=UPI000FDC0B6A|nr:hypothetical protein [Actinoplanes solisilvae]
MSVDPAAGLRVLHRLALGVEPFDAMTGARAGSAVRVGREVTTRPRRRRPASVLDLVTARPTLELEGSGNGRFKLRHQPGVGDRVLLRVDDPGRRWVPRRFDVELWTSADAGPAIPVAARTLQPRLLPGAAWNPPRGSTCVRGRVSWAGRPVRWPRLVATEGDANVGWAHGDENGEFLLVVTGLGTAIGPLPDTLNLDLIVQIPDPAAPADPHDPVADLVVEPIDRALSQPAPGTAAHEVLIGRAAPAGYFVSSVPFPVTVVVGETLARLDVPFNP